jgi:hypothetical protein
MQASRKLTLVLALVLAAMAVFDFAVGAPALRLTTDTGAVQAAAAVLGLACVAIGSRACNVYLVSVGLLFGTDAFMGFTRGLFYLSFDALRGAVEPLPRPARFIASLPHLVLGVVALVAGLRFANAEARERRDGAPPI